MGIFTKSDPVREAEEALHRLRAMDVEDRPRLPAIVPTRPAQAPKPPHTPVQVVAAHVEHLKTGDLLRIANELHTIKVETNTDLAHPVDFLLLLNIWAEREKDKFLSSMRPQTEGPET